MTVCLLYHGIGVSPEGGHRSLDIDPMRFERQMRHLASRSPAIMITFDDAFAALGDFALPLMIDLGLKATVFVVTGAVGKDSSWTGEALARPIMDATAIRDFAAKGIGFGAHTRSHPDLRTLPDEKAETEIAGSKAELEDLVGRSVAAFAYPFGFYDRRIRDITARHFDRAYTTREGRIRGGADPLALNRTMVQPLNPFADFRLQCRLGFSPLETLRRWKRG